MMKKSLITIGAVLLSACAATAEDVPQMEAFLGYNYVRFNPNSIFFPSFNANGGGGQFVYNFNRWIGGVGDISAVTAGSVGGLGIDSTVVNFVAGPRFTYRNESRFQPFGQVLFGGAYSTASLPVTAAIVPGGNHSASGFCSHGPPPCFQHWIRNVCRRRTRHQTWRTYHGPADWRGLLFDASA
jgi:hypothetical protein